VIRLCKRLGYKGFKDLRNDILREVTRESFETAGVAGMPGDIDRSDSLEDIIAKVSRRRDAVHRRHHQGPRRRLPGARSGRGGLRRPH